MLGAVQVFIAAAPDLAPSQLAGLLADRATGSVPLQETAVMLAGLTQGLVLTLIPLAAGVAGFIWLGAWIWHSYRPYRLALAWMGGAATCVALWLIAEFPLVNTGQSTFVWLAAATPAVVLTSLLVRSNVGGTRKAFTSAHQSEPYLQKLLGVRADLQSRPTDDAEDKPSSLADFEIGKEVHSWEGGRVNWGRQPSLDRAVLIWLHVNDPTSPAGQTGVVVRHPFVLNLHAVGQGEEGRFLVTEAVAATPLAILLQRGPFAPLEAVTLAIRLGHAIQSFHDQGACHGQVQPDWILVRGELEPVLCPCGIPSPSSEDQARDVQALGQLLSQWLPARSRGWSLDPQASLYRVCDAACTGVYRRAADLAIDLERCLQLIRLRRRMRWANGLALALLILPLLVVAGMWLNQRSNPGATEAVISINAANRAIGMLIAICSCSLVVGCTQVRFWIRRKRLHLSRIARGRIGSGGTLGSMIPLGLSATLAVALGIFGVSEAHGAAGVVGTVLLVLAEMAGFWVLGGFVAALASGLDVLLHSLPGGSRDGAGLSTEGEAPQ
jgi:tRNA A-37 threonylcarbamoyl transferase component Bud32